MVTQYAHSPEDIRHYDTDKLREQFLMPKLFEPGNILLTYTYNDRMIFGGVTPTMNRWRSSWTRAWVSTSSCSGGNWA